MALSWSTVTIDNVASIGTSEKLISAETNPGSAGISILPNERCIMSVSIGTHGTDDVTVTVYGRLASTGGWYLIKSFVIAAGDTDEHEVFDFLGGPEHVDVGFVASGSTDNPTATSLCRKSPVNGA